MLWKHKKFVPSAVPGVEHAVIVGDRLQVDMTSGTYDFSVRDIVFAPLS